MSCSGDVMSAPAACLVLCLAAGQSGVVRVGPERRPVVVSIAPNPSHLEVRQKQAAALAQPAKPAAAIIK